MTEQRDSELRHSAVRFWIECTGFTRALPLARKSQSDRMRNFIRKSFVHKSWERFSTAINQAGNRGRPDQRKGTNERRTSNVQHRTSNNVFCLF